MYSTYVALLRIAAALGALALLLICAIVTIDVIVRWVTGQPILGVYEYSGLLLIVAIFLPLGMMQHTERHIRVEIVTEYLPRRGRASADVLDALAGITVAGILIWAAIPEFLMAWRNAYRSAGVIEIPRAIPVGVILISFLLMVPALFAALARNGKTLVKGSEDRS